MGGRGSGGMRVNAGRKSKDEQVAALHGSRQRSAGKPAQGAAFELLPAPSCLTEPERTVWDELAPLACKALTLTATTAPGFRELCEAIVLKRMMLAEILADGL